MRRRRLCLIALACLAGVASVLPVFAEEGAPPLRVALPGPAPLSVGERFFAYSLRGTVGAVLARDPRLREASARVDASEAGVMEQLMRYAPVVTGSIDSSLAVSTGFDAIDRGHGVGQSFGAIGLTVPLYDGGRREAGIAKARELALAERWRYKAVRDDVAIETVGTLVDAWLSVRAAAIVEDRIARLSALRTSLRSREAQGFASAAEVARLDAEIASARRDYNEIAARGAKARGAIGRLSGRAPADIRRLPPLARFVPRSRDEIARMARRANPGLQAAAAEYRAALHQTRESFGRLMPQLNATADYRKDFERPDHLASRDGYTFGLQLKIPLLDLSAQAASEADRARSDAALHREARLRDTVAIDVDSLWIDRGRFAANAGALSDEVEARRASASAARDRFAKGFGTLEEVIDAENDLDESRRLAVLSAGEAFMVDARLLVAGGLFRPSMLDAGAKSAKAG